MSDVTQPRMARGTLLPAGILAAALFALLALAPFASAAPAPVAGGTTTVTLNGGFANALKKNGVKLLQISPATLKGKTVTLPVSGGSVDPVSGQGSVTHSGGIRFKAGKKSVALTSLELNTTTASLSAKVGKKTLRVASVTGFTTTRDGFGVDLKVAKLKLTGKAAKELNKALAAPIKKKGKKGKASTSKKKKATAKAKPIFKANQVLGGSISTTQPSSLAVLPTGNATLTTALPTVTKLAKVGVKIDTVAPTTVAAEGPPPAYSFPIGGESIAPTATAGIVKTSGGLKLNQVFVPGEVETTMTLGNIWVDLGAKTATVEVVVESKGISDKLNLGTLGRSSIADVSLTGATVTADPATRTVSVQNASATLQAVTAEVLNSVFVEGYEGVTKDTGKEKFVAGDPLGTFSFTAQTE